MALRIYEATLKRKPAKIQNSGCLRSGKGERSTTG